MHELFDGDVDIRGRRIDNELRLLGRFIGEEMPVNSLRLPARAFL